MYDMETRTATGTIRTTGKGRTLVCCPRCQKSGCGADIAAYQPGSRFLSQPNGGGFHKQGGHYVLKRGSWEKYPVAGSKIKCPTCQWTVIIPEA